MTDPFAVDLSQKDKKKKPEKDELGPLAFEVDQAINVSTEIEPEADLATAPKRSFWPRLFWGSLSLLITLGIGLALERLVRDLFSTYPALGYVGLSLVALMVIALLGLIIREFLGLRRLKTLAKLKHEASAAHSGKNLPEAQKAVQQLRAIYEGNPAMARQLAEFDRHAKDILDGDQLLEFAERTLLVPLDEKAKAIIANSAQRISLVTAVSPRAFFDIMFVLYEAARLTRRIAQLYGARPSFFGFVEMSKSVMAHLALTGGIALGDSVVQQLLGHGLAARLSAKLGEGVINGLMTVRVGIAAIAVIRPLPYMLKKGPAVSDFLPALTKLAKDQDQTKGQ